MISVISFIVAVLVISGLIYYLLKQKAKPNKRKFSPAAMEEPEANDGGNSQFNPALVQAKWPEIQAMSKSGPSGLKSGLMEADKLLDYCMIGKGFEGETMGDRLKSGGKEFSNLNAVWNAHKLRNQLAHEVEIDVVADQVKQAINDLGQGIRDLGVTV